MFVSIKTRTSVKMGHVRSKTRSLGQILGKPCVRCRGRTFSPILMKLGQNVCLNDVLDKFRKGFVRSKTRPQTEILGKPCVCLETTFFSPILMKLGQNVCLNVILNDYENGLFQVKN